MYDYFVVNGVRQRMASNRRKTQAVGKTVSEHPEEPRTTELTEQMLVNMFVDSYGKLNRGLEPNRFALRDGSIDETARHH